MLEKLKEKRIGFFTFVYKEVDGDEKELVKIRYISRANEFNVNGSVKFEEVVTSDNDGQINKLDEIIAFLQGLPEGSNLKAILDNINTESLTEEEKGALEALVNSDGITEEEIGDAWAQAMRDAGLSIGTQDAASGGGTDDSGD